eukprot:jgi/Bigna1/129539/aug1.9_g4247
MGTLVLEGSSKNSVVAVNKSSISRGTVLGKERGSEDDDSDIDDEEDYDDDDEDDELEDEDLEDEDEDEDYEEGIPSRKQRFHRTPRDRSTHQKEMVPESQNMERDISPSKQRRRFSRQTRK